jgi:hypothetical protein
MAQAVSVFKVGGSAMAAQQRPARDITPRAAPLTYQRPQAKPKAALPARKPLAVAPPAKPKAAPAAPAGESDWESF